MILSSDTEDESSTDCLKTLIAANLFSQIIFFSTHPEKRQSIQIKRHKKTAKFLRRRFFGRSVASVSLFPLRRISTPHKYKL